MATFHQEGQTVRYQLNAETINFGEARTKDEFLLQLKNLLAELSKANAMKSIPKNEVMEAAAHVQSAIHEVEKDTSDKNALVENLTVAKELVSNASGLAVAIGSAITAVGALF